MKKIVVMLAVLLTVSLLAACGGEPDISGTIHQTQPATQSTTSPEEGTTLPEETTEPSEGAHLELGRLQGGVYSSEYLGITCTLDENWVYYSAAELQELPENTAELLQGTQVGETMEKLTQITDMQAENATELTTVNVLYTKISLQERLAYLALSQEGVIDSVLAQRDMLEESYAQAGMPVQEMKKVTVTFLGEERPALWTHCDIQGVAYYILQVYDYTKGQYSATITMGSFMEDKTQDLLSLFQPIQ